MNYHFNYTNPEYITLLSLAKYQLFIIRHTKYFVMLSTSPTLATAHQATLLNGNNSSARAISLLDHPRLELPLVAQPPQPLSFSRRELDVRLDDDAVDQQTEPGSRAERDIEPGGDFIWPT
ncbi:unnamed protein product [Clonostachys rhizophaga]|uniref:Uncharacterized protein n=1 Tax=Clonostachys rhizophaga TaxID=160324 RepID=A0A9N9VPK2_9HYPO|nr:unnamed protein product [Clonostachys rhizophaga]